MNQPECKAEMPKGIGNAFLFQFFNAASWSLLLGTPMLLYLKNLGASGTVLGIAVAIVPLFGILQIPAADYAERVGYRPFVLRGWALRSIFILGIAAVVLLPEWVSPGFRIAMVLVLFAFFATVRGISMCGYLPWITHIVPEPLRGWYISRDLTFMYAAITLTMILSSVWVKFFPASRLFGVLFMLSYVAALVSLVFLKRIPDITMGAAAQKTRHPPWREMLFFPPFFRFIIFNIVLNFFVAALGVLWVPFMRDKCGASGSLILGLSAYANVLSAFVSMWAGRITDRFGSRPLIGVSGGLIILGQSFWMVLAAGMIPPATTFLYGIVTIGATGFAILGVANTRLLMGTVPATARSHFFAIAGVAAGLTLGIMPIVWGVILDATELLVPHEIRLGSRWAWNSYSLLYAIIVTGLLSAQFFFRRLSEPRTVSTEEFLRILFIQAPVRLVGRVLLPLRRFRPFG